MVKQWVASSLVRIRVMRRGDAGEMVCGEELGHASFRARGRVAELPVRLELGAVLFNS